MYCFWKLMQKIYYHISPTYEKLKSLKAVIVVVYCFLKKYLRNQKFILTELSSHCYNAKQQWEYCHYIFSLSSVLSNAGPFVLFVLFWEMPVQRNLAGISHLNDKIKIFFSHFSVITVRYDNSLNFIVNIIYDIWMIL